MSSCTLDLTNHLSNQVVIVVAVIARDVLTETSFEDLILSSCNLQPITFLHLVM